jgi:hypothetical protein
MDSNNIIYKHPELKLRKLLILMHFLVTSQGIFFNCFNKIIFYPQSLSLNCLAWQGNFKVNYNDIEFMLFNIVLYNIDTI